MAGYARFARNYVNLSVPVSRDDAHNKPFPQFPTLVKQLRYSTVDSNLRSLIAELELYENDSLPIIEFALEIAGT